MTLDLETALRTTAWIAGFGVIVGSLELLQLRREFEAGGFYDGRVVRTDLPDMPAAWLEGAIAWAFHPRAFPVLAIVRAAAGAVMLIAPIETDLSGAAVWTAFLTTLLVHLRCQYGLDGSDQMLLIVLGSLSIAAIAPNIAPLCLIFVAMQSVLAYATAGVAKAVSPKWRSWRAMAWIMNSETYGARWIARTLLDHPVLATALGWSVLLAECSFPLAILVPGLLPAYLAWGAAFHAATAAIMGLNVFFWAFIATYPAIIWLTGRIWG